MIRISKNEICCGCGACSNICPKNCIKMIQDEEGFFYPKIDENECVQCNLCEKTCPFLSQIKTHSVFEFYGCQLKDLKVRRESSSGGIFSVLALEIIKDGGAVFGVAMSNDCKTARFMKAENEAELHLLRGSKYIQSESGDVYRQVRMELEKNRKVLFTGTPCHINALKLFLRREYSNLLCMDVICHGVPTPELWRKYIESFEVENKKVIAVNFRCKQDNLRNFGHNKIDKNREVYYMSKDDDPFMQMFLKNLCLRPSCYKCKVKQNRLSDITAADFWGIGKLIPEFNDNLGTSLVLIRTDRGKNAFEQVKNNLWCKQTEYSNAVVYNPSELKSVLIPQKRSDFMNDMKKMNFTQLNKKYVGSLFQLRLKNLIKKSVLFKLLRGETVDKVSDNMNYGIMVTVEK